MFTIGSVKQSRLVPSFHYHQKTLQRLHSSDQIIWCILLTFKTCRQFKVINVTIVMKFLINCLSIHDFTEFFSIQPFKIFITVSNHVSFLSREPMERTCHVLKHFASYITSSKNFWTVRPLKWLSLEGFPILLLLLAIQQLHPWSDKQI